MNKSDIQLVKSLKRASKRKEEKLFIVEGIKDVAELLEEEHFKVRTIFALQEDLEELRDRALEETNVYEASQKAIDSASHFSNSKGPIVVVEIPEAKKSIKLQTESINLYFDRIRDPGNLGTILRTADWFGVKQIWCSPDSVDCYNSKVISASKGSINRVRVIYQDAVELLNEARDLNIPIRKTGMEGNKLGQKIGLNGSLLFFGNESEGLNEELEDLIEEKIYIDGQAKAESLNLAMSTGIILHSWYSNL